MTGLSAELLERMTPDQRAMAEQLLIHESARKRVEMAGYDCRFVYRVWSPGESDMLLDGEPVETALCVSSDGQPFTAGFAKDGSVVVEEGW